MPKNLSVKKKRKAQMVQFMNASLAAIRPKFRKGGSEYDRARVPFATCFLFRFRLAIKVESVFCDGYTPCRFSACHQIPLIFGPRCVVVEMPRTRGGKAGTAATTEKKASTRRPPPTGRSRQSVNFFSTDFFHTEKKSRSRAYSHFFWFV